ncbi:MAG: hypothetical protein IPN58_21550 [Anaerolineales bacterium]|nr:hypothetical protein [Anaerolineales bacterium]
MKNLANKLHITPPVVFLFILIQNFWLTLYAVFSRETPSAFTFMDGIIFIWLITWWVKEDNKNHLQGRRVWGRIVFLWFLAIPIYLFKTRKAGALISFLKYLLINLVTLIAGFVLAIFIKGIYLSL